MLFNEPRRHLAFLIHDVAKRMRQEFGRRAARFDLTPAQARCLVVLAFHPGASLKALAAALEVQSMSVLRVIDSLEERRLLRRESDREDRRALKLFLTKEGESVARRIGTMLDDIIEEACAGIRASGREAIATSLTQLSTGMQQFDAKAVDEARR